MVQAQAPRPKPPGQCHPGPRTPTRGRDVPFTLASGSPERSTQHRGPDSDFFPGEPPGPVLWTISPPSVRPASACQPGRPPPPRGTRLPTDYLVHALQTTLWTFSLLFKSPPGEGGGKIQRRSESIEMEKVSKGCPQRRKSPDSADLQTTTGFSGGCGRPLPTGTRPEAWHPQPPRPSFRQKGLHLHLWEALFLVLGTHLGY
nr:uncharacterized protein LOC123479428 isoform X2 [Desmodus rotundus]